MSGELTVGIGLGLSGAPATQFVEEARRAADMGFDVVEVPDHLGQVAPLPTLAAIAAAAPTLRLTNHVLNASFYRPHLLARDIAAVHQLSGGRFITSLGTGYAEAEFVTAGIPFPSAGQRVDRVRETALAIRDILADPTFVASTGLPVPLTRIAGKGNRILAFAADMADIVMVDPDLTETALAERIDYVRAQAGDRVDDVIVGFPFSQLALDDPNQLHRMRRLNPDATDEEIRALPTVLTGTIDDAVAKIQRIRQLGVDWITLIRGPEVSWNTLEKLITALRQAD